MNTDTRMKTAEDVRFVENVAKETQTTWKKIVSIKPNGQTDKKITLHFQDLVTYTRYIR